MKTRLLPLICAILIALSACKSSSEQSSTTTDATQATGSVELGIPEGTSEETRKAIQEGLMGDPSMFPYVYAGPNYTNWFEAYSMRFQLQYTEQWYPMTNLETPWLKPDNYSEKAGNFITYVRNGRDLTLTNPYTAVQYIRRTMPYTSTMDSIFLWLDDTHLNRKAGTVITEQKTIMTASKVEAVVKEYTNPGVEDIEKPSKYIAYAYLPYNEEYFLGFAMTCGEKSDFDMNKPLFYDLVASFQYR
ncbi:MAG: hypothetical protein AAF927_34360 [Bacteroidota bacterium]